MNINELLDAEKLHLKKMHDLVQEAVQEENLLSQKLLQAEQDQNLSTGQRLADRIAEFGGSWLFIILFSFIILIWISSNAYLLLDKSFDPYPFILLNLILSCLAAFQAPVLMMSQNRQEEKDRRRARNDYLINLKAEMEIRNLHGKMDLIITDQMQAMFEIQKEQLNKIDELTRTISKLASVQNVN
jgi:uncharacterized membrane protein